MPGFISEGKLLALRIGSESKGRTGNGIGRLRTEKKKGDRPIFHPPYHPTLTCLRQQQSQARARLFSKKFWNMFFC